MDALVRTPGALGTLTVALLWGLCGLASAVELQREGPRLRVIGALDASGLGAFTGHLERGDVRTVVFEDSRGGSADIAERYARAVREAGVNTEVRGHCTGACPAAFLAGKEHRFGRGPQVNSLLIPLGARPESGDLAQLGAPPPARLASIEVSAVTPAAREPEAATVKEPWRPDQGVLFTSTPTLFGRVYNSFYCDGTQGRDLSRCEVLSDADPYRLGVLTLQ